MAATEHAVIVGGTVTNVVLIDTTTEDGAAYLQALVAAGDTVVDISGISPQPGVDWTTADGGQTFTAPPPTPSLAAPTPNVDPATQATALANVQQLTTTLPAQISQSQADYTTLQGLVAGQALTAEQIAAIQRNQGGWAQVLQALGDIVAAAGLATPPPGS